MGYTLSTSEVAVKDFVASSLEATAEKMPNSMKDKAEVLRKAAAIYREYGSNQKLSVAEEEQDERFYMDKYTDLPILAA